MRFIFGFALLLGLAILLAKTDWRDEYKARVETEWAYTCVNPNNVEAFWRFMDSEDRDAAADLVEQTVGEDCVLLPSGTIVFVNRESNVPFLLRIRGPKLMQIRIEGSTAYFYSSMRQIRSLN